MKKVIFILGLIMIFALRLIWGQLITEGFESGMPTSYTTGSATLGSGTWTGTEFIRGTTRHSGSYSCQLRSTTGSEITTPTFTTSGVGTVKLWAAKSTAGTGPALQVRISVDGGVFTQVGSTLSLDQNIFNEFSVDVNNSGSNLKIRFYRTSGTVYIDDVTITGYYTPNAWINEIHYDNDGVDTCEALEIVIENAGSYALNDFQVNLYNGSGGASYSSETVNNFTEGNNYNNFTIYTWTKSEIQNGPDGMALSYDGTLISGQFLSYEGSFAATDGPANGVTSTNIGVSETGSTPEGQSLQLTGNGTEYADFSWSGPESATFGSENRSQTLPVTLSTFTAQYLNSKPTLYWQTQSEEDNMGWFIYRNTIEDFTSAEKITGMIEGHGTTTQPQSYIYEDAEQLQIEQTYYYWLESVDYGGTLHHYDRVAQITIPHPDEPGQNVTPPVAYDISADPNPFSHTTNISFVMDKASKVDVAIYNIKGELVKSFSSVMTTSENEIVNFHWNGKDNSGKALSNGVYLYSVKVNGKDYATRQLILMK